MEKIKKIVFLTSLFLVTVQAKLMAMGVNPWRARRHRWKRPHPGGGGHHGGGNQGGSSSQGHMPEIPEGWEPLIMVGLVLLVVGIRYYFLKRKKQKEIGPQVSPA